jgi:hypothetical protein
MREAIDESYKITGSVHNQTEAEAEAKEVTRANVKTPETQEGG